jgi:hypothetical protein
LICWGPPSGPPKPPALRAPAEPWRFASVQSGPTTRDDNPAARVLTQ